MQNVPASEIANRIVALQTLLESQEVDLAIIRQNADLYYFTGTVQDAHLLIPAAGQPLLLVRRDVQRAEAQTPIRPVVPMHSIKELVPAAEQSCGGRARSAESVDGQVRCGADRCRRGACAPGQSRCGSVRSVSKDHRFQPRQRVLCASQYARPADYDDCEAG